uniref:Mucin-5AC-like isoform X3 n=1 Tax=Hirondellea gigas TaxID=1518452 RepID=A0A6A7G4E8_9CRUS
MLLNSTRGGGSIGGVGERGGPSIVAHLKVRVSRLEAVLRDKEVELGRLQASTKASTVNELRIQAHTYYQEVVRLRNQLNISQHATVPIIQSSTGAHAGSTPVAAAAADVNNSNNNASSLLSSDSAHPGRLLHKRSQLRSNKFSSNNMAARDAEEEEEEKLHEEPPSPLRGDGADDHELQKSVMMLHEENNKLREQVITLVNTIQNSTSQGVSNDARDALERVMEKLEEKKRDAAGVDASSSYLQCRMSELQGKEVDWERERASLRELIATLQDDRSFYKQTASKKESEMEALKTEVLTLQKEMVVVRELENSASSGPAAVRPSPRTTNRTLNRPGSGTSTDSASSSSRYSRTQSSVRTTSSIKQPAPQPRSSISKRTATTTIRHATKATSEPRELPPKHPNANPMTSSVTGAPEKSGSSSSGGGTVKRSSATTSNISGSTTKQNMTKKQQQMATSMRLASTTATRATPNSRPNSGSSKTAATGTTARTGTGTTATTTPRSGVGYSHRSSSTVPSRTNTRNVSSSASQHSSSSATRSNTSSATSSKTSSQKATPVTSPSKTRSSIIIDSKTSKSSSLSSNLRKTSSESKSSSHNVSKVSKSSNGSSSHGSPAKPAHKSPSKMPVPNKRPGVKKLPYVAADSSSGSEQSSAAESGRASPQPTSVFSVITEEDAHILVELLRPEPLKSSSDGSSNGSVEAAAAAGGGGDDGARDQLHWDTSTSASGQHTTDDDGWETALAAHRLVNCSAAVKEAENKSTTSAVVDPSVVAATVAFADVTATTAAVTATTTAAVTATSAAVTATTAAVTATTAAVTETTVVEEPATTTAAVVLAADDDDTKFKSDKNASASRSSHDNRRIVESLDELKSLLCSHLHRQQKLNSLLEQEPQLLPQELQARPEGVKRRLSRTTGLRHRRSPDGAEGDQALAEPTHAGPPASATAQPPPSTVATKQSPSKIHRTIVTPTKAAPAPVILASKIPASPGTSQKFPATAPAPVSPPTAPPPPSSSCSSKLPHVTKTPPTLTKLASPSKKPNKSSPKSIKKSTSSDSATSSPGLVRQGTFNLDQSDAFVDRSCMADGGEGDQLGNAGWIIDDDADGDQQALTATLSAHIARLHQLKSLKD